MLKKILLSLAVGMLWWGGSVSRVEAQSAGTLADPYQVRTVSTIYIAPPATSSGILSFSGVALSRFQPIPSAGIDSGNPAHYTEAVEIEDEDEWVVTLYNQSGALQMVEATVSGQLTQVFSLDYQDPQVFKNLYSADLDLADMGISNTNIKVDERIFKLQVDYLYRTPNNIEWRFSADPFFYKVSTDVYAPMLNIYRDCDPMGSGICVPMHSGNINYNDSSFELQLYAVDPDVVGGEIVVNTGLLRYRYSWVEDTTGGVASCNDYWQTASGSAIVWQGALNTGVPNDDGLLYQDTTTLADVETATPSAQLLCYQVEDNAGNVGNDEARFNLVLPKYITLSCGDYRGQLYGTCSGSECDNLLLNPIALWGQSSLVNGLATDAGEEMLGNTLSCDITTNSQTGYELQVAAQTSANMMGSGGSEFIGVVSGTIAVPQAWPDPLTSSQWGLRVHSASGADIYDSTDWGADSYTGGKWAGVTTTDQVLYSRDSNLNLSSLHTEVAADDRAVVQFGVEVKDTDNLPKGTYVVNLTFTVTTVDD
ncbi:hypothetical protein FWH30_00755 [Microgenomates group bacterium]|nr:hypothetical protein [Microgenomates group bacterium]